MLYSSDIFPIFPTVPLERTPQNIARVSKYRAKPEDTTPIALSFIWTNSVYKWVYALVCHGLVCVRRRYSKCYPSPTKSPLSLQRLASCRGGQSLLVWLLEFTCPSVQTYICLPLKWVGSNDVCVSTPQCRELRKLRADSAEGETSAVSLSCPSLLSQAHTMFPGWLVPVILEAAGSFHGGLCSSQAHPRHYWPCMNRWELGEMWW